MIAVAPAPTVALGHDPVRVAALGRKFDDPARVLLGVLNAAILSRDPGHDTVVADAGGLPLGFLTQVGPGGYHIGDVPPHAGGKSWRVVNVVNDESVVMQRCG